MSTPLNRRRMGRRHTRRLSQTRPRTRRPASTPPAAGGASEVVDLDVNADHDETCIDLTTGDEGEVIDLTSVNDSPVVVLSAIDGRRRSRSVRVRGRRRGHGSPRSSVPSRTQRMYVSSDESEEELPFFEIPGTPIRTPSSGEGTSANMASPQEVMVSCPICMDDYKQIRRNGRHIMSTTCGHMFCNDCIRQAVNAQHCCPTCRKRLSHRQTHPLFF